MLLGEAGNFAHITGKGMPAEVIAEGGFFLQQLFLIRPALCIDQVLSCPAEFLAEQSNLSAAPCSPISRIKRSRDRSHQAGAMVVEAVESAGFD